MTSFSVKISERDLESHVDKLRRKQHRRAAVTLHSSDGWDGPTQLTLGGEPAEVHVCPTLLALRAALRTEEGKAPWQFFITPLTDEELTLDLREKLVPHQRILLPNLSDSLKAKFSATRQHSDVVEDRTDIPAILSYLDDPDIVVRPAPAGVLSAAHVSQELLFGGLFKGKFGTLTELLTWSAKNEAGADWDRFVEKLPERVRSRALDWLRTELGSHSGGAIRHLAAHGPAELIANGLVAEVLIPAPGIDAGTQSVALGGFRVTTGTGNIRSDELDAWSQAAISVFKELPDEKKSVAAYAHTIISSPQRLDSRELVHLSSVIDVALDDRLTAMAAAVEEYLATSNTSTLYPAHENIHKHVRASQENRDVRTADAVVRLIQWKERAKKAEPGTVSEWLNYYRDDLSWVDTCLNAAWWRQDNRRLGDAARTLADGIRAQRASADRSFAAAVAATGTGSAVASEVLLIEDVLKDVVKPLLGSTEKAPHPVLLLVVDGCSVPAANDLIQSIMSTYPGTWQELLPVSDRLRTALAAFPTITNVSRASLLSGTITSGGQNVEKQGFESFYQSLNRNVTGARLLHKSHVETGINDKVRDLVEDTSGTPLLAAVLNEIDDSLNSSNPMDRTWSVNEVRFFADLLKGAARVGRTVVLVSDHGHIAERHMSDVVSGTDASSARWRPALGDSPTAGEILVSGPRVIAQGSSEAILAVDETVRYTSKTAGYHGGLSLAEASVPVTVLTQSVSSFEDNEIYPGETMAASMRFPSWWEIREAAAQVEQSKPKATALKQTPTDQESLDFGLFEAPPTPVDLKDRFSSLMKSSDSLLNQQFKAHPVRGRSVSDVVALLRAIGTNNGRLPLHTLREKWDLSNLALRGSVSSLQRIVNMDGIEVLTVDNTDLVLNTDLLFEQFGV